LKEGKGHKKRHDEKEKEKKTQLIKTHKEKQRRENERGDSGRISKMAALSHRLGSMPRQILTEKGQYLGEEKDSSPS